jgi:hypothetical protein
MKSGSRGPDWDSEGFRDLRQRIPQVVMEDDDRPMLRSQTGEGVLEGRPIRDGARGIGFDKGRDRVHAASGPAASTARFGVARMHDESMQPGVESDAIAKGR